MALRRPSPRRRGGWTLTELILVSAILGLVISIVPKAIMNMTRFFNLSLGQVETERDSRTAMTLLTRKLRTARAASLVVDRLDASAPPASRLTFSTVEGSTVVFRQNGHTLEVTTNGGPPGVLTKNLRVVTFFYPDSSAERVLGISLVTEKTVAGGGAPSFELNEETLRVMN